MAECNQTALEASRVEGLRLRWLTSYMKLTIHHTWTRSIRDWRQN